MADTKDSSSSPDNNDQTAFDKLAQRASVRAAVETREDLTLTWEHLTVHVDQNDDKKKTRFVTLPGRKDNFGLGVDDRPSYNALQRVSGWLSTGEMVLVLSPDQQSASAMLQTLSGRQVTGVAGTMAVNGAPLLLDKKPLRQGWQRVMAHVATSDASHAPNLTVRETLTFAAECTSESSGAAAMEKINAAVDAFLQVLDLTHVADTVVGDEQLRGVSGGQKRRVTIGEMMFGQAKRFMALEYITNGLSSQDSYNILSGLKQACQMFKIGAIISLLQPSDEMLQLFDRMLVLDDVGGMAYWGPVDRGILHDLFVDKKEDGDNNKKTYSKDAGSICDLVLGNKSRQSWQAIGHRYQDSPTGQALVRGMRERNSLGRADVRGIENYLPPTKYAKQWKDQFRVIANRRLKLVRRNAATYIRVLIAITFGVIIGSVFSEIENDMQGSLARTGFMFVNCFLTLTLSAAFTIPMLFRERVTLFKHRTAQFYSGRIAYITQVVLDVPLNLLEAIILASISYYWVGLNSSPNRFFFFLGVLAALEMAGQALARFISSLSKEQIYATSMSSIWMLIMGSVSGFMPGYTDIPVIFRWMSWVTPVSYAFEAVMINEFSGRSINTVVLSGDDGQSAPVMAGETWLNNNDLPRRSWTSYEGIKLFDIFMVVVLAVFFDTMGYYFIEKNREWFFYQVRRIQLRIFSEYFIGKKKMAQPIKTEGKVADGVEEAAESSSGESTWPSTLVVKNICYYVPYRGASKSDKNELQLLRDVSAIFRRGRMTALMGTSGAGKTTLLDVIAGYKTGGRITGDILIDSTPKQSKTWKRISGYAEQQDILNPWLSVIETLRFTAACRLPRSTDREKVVENVIRLVELEEWRNNLVGREIEEKGLPKHARKRLTIAVQLVMQPKILFLDEPTTGLGTSAANFVMQAVRRVTSEMNLITVATIHQPSKLIWDEFDDLLLLVKGGAVAYMGEMGTNSETVISHFEDLTGIRAAPQVNPADFVISAVSSVSADEASIAFHSSRSSVELTNSISLEEKQSGSSNRSDAAIAKVLEESKAGLDPFSKLYILTVRHTIANWRNPAYSIFRLCSSTFVALYMGILFNSAGGEEITAAVFTIGSVAFFVYILLIPMRSAVIPLVEDRPVLYREVLSGLYSRFVYGLGQILSDIVFHAGNAFLMFVMFYFPAGFRREGEAMGYFFLLIFLTNWVLCALGQLYAVVLPNEESAIGIAGLTHFLSVLLMGFLIMERALPDGWVWAYWANLFHYVMQGFNTNQLAGTMYQVLPPPDIEFPSNGTAFLFETGTDLSSGGIAQQSASFLDLALQAAPFADVQQRSDYDWENSGIVALSDLLKCMVENDCLVEPIAQNFVSCCIASIPPPPPCRAEFNRGTETIDVVDLLACFAPISNSTVELETSSGFARGIPDDFTVEAFEATDAANKLQIVLCLMGQLLPPGLGEDIRERIVQVIKRVWDLIVVVIDILENGIWLPGDVILWVFGWAEFDNGELTAPYKWYYCMFAVACFLVGIELFKLLSITFIVWTKR